MRQDYRSDDREPRFWKGMAIVVGCAWLGLLGYMAFTPVAVSDEQARQDLARHIQQHSEDEANRTSQFNQHVADQKVLTDGLRADVDQIQQDVTGLLLRRPPEFDYRGLMNTGTELRRRVEQLERARWGMK